MNTMSIATDPAPVLPNSTENPYVGPYAFTEAEASRFFGREREARELLALVLRERLVLFYAQSGAGKSSLLHARLIPDLREHGFEVLPVGRVSGELPDGLDPVAVNNIFIYNLLFSLNHDLPVTEQVAVSTLGKRTLLAFLAGEEVAGGHCASPATADLAPTVLIIDQFEEIVTTHLERWLDRGDFFVQLQTALAQLSNLWVVLTLREDYVAPLEPYAELLPNRLRARYYMQRMGATAALEAIERPVADSDHPFAVGVAQTLVDNLCRVRVPGQREPQPGPVVEPVQLQVVCYQLWKNVCTRPCGPITQSDLPLGYIDQALMHFYEDALADVLHDSAVQQVGVSERMLRTWFSDELITETGIRNMLLRNEQTAHTGTLANAAVDHLVRRYLLRTELRAGGAWVELVHDRFVEPIRHANQAWVAEQANPLTAVTKLWLDNSRDPARLLRGIPLEDAQAYATACPHLLTADEQMLLKESVRRQGEEREHALRAVRNRRIIALVTFTVLLALVSLTAWALINTNEAKRQREVALAEAQNAAHAQATSEANAELAQEQLNLLEGDRLVLEARRLSVQGDITGTLAFFKAALHTNPKLKIDLAAEEQVVRKQAATMLVQAGEKLASRGNYKEAGEKYQEALDLNPPSDTPVYIWVAAGEFTMGSKATDQYTYHDEQPQHKVTLDGYWIMRTEVTNAQYFRCMQAMVCEPLEYTSYSDPQLATLPTTRVTWQQAATYAMWVGGRLPTEAEWEKACRGADARIWPWGNKEPTPELLSYAMSNSILTNVGSHPKGASPYGLMDMAGNVWEWTADWYYEKYYETSPTDNPEGPERGETRTVRGGSSRSYEFSVRCADRGEQNNPSVAYPDVGFRVVTVPAMEAKRSYASSLVDQGIDLVDEGNLEAAIAKFDQALTLDPSNAIAHYHLGNAYFTLKDYNQAITDYTQAIQLDPTSVDAYNNRGLAYCSEQKYTEAIADFTQVIELDPENADAYNGLCWWRSLTDPAKTVVQTACERAVELAPDNGYIRDSRGLARALIGDNAGAIADFRAFVAWGEHNGVSDELLNKRREWIRQLEAGQNPFDEETLAQLRKE